MHHPQGTTRRLVHAHLPFIFSRLLAHFVKVEHMSSKVLLSTPFTKMIEVTLLVGRHGLRQGGVGIKKKDLGSIFLVTSHGLNQPPNVIRHTSTLGNNYII